MTRLVARREITERVQGRLLRVMTALTAALVVAGIVIPSLVRGSSKPTTIGLVGPSAQALAPALQRSAAATNVRVKLYSVTTDALARSEVRNGTLDLALSAGPAGVRAEVKQSLSAADRSLLQATLDEAHLLQTLARAGVPAVTIASALTPVPLTTRALEPSSPDRQARAIAALAASLLMYLSLSLYGAAVANGVAQEKTSRTAEVLLAAVRPEQLLGGKVIGIGLTGLGQLAIAAAAGLIANAFVHSATIPGSVWVLLPSFLVYFLLGFALYAFAFAAAGAIVARQEEVQFVTLPFGMILLGGYLLVYAAIASPNAAWLRVISFLPPLTASLMPARIALGHVAAWEIPVDVLIMILSIYATTRLAARIYTAALVRGGARISWRDAVQPRAR
jgi:ABC-2 type transport system permease protein